MLASLVCISVSIVLLSATAWASPLRSDENLLENPGFEAGSGDIVDVWGFYGDVTWTDQEVYSGERALRVAAENSSSSIQSSWLQAPAHSRVEIGAWLKAQDVVSNGTYRRLRVTLNTFVEDQETRIFHWDLITLDGTFDWTHFQSSIIVPPDVAYFRLSIQLTETSGTFWIDDVTARVVQTLPAVEALDLGSPVVIPQPWQMRATGEILPIGRVGIAGTESDQRLRQQLTHLLKQMELDYVFVSEGDSADLYDTLLLIGDRGHAELDRHFQDRFPHIGWNHLGDQGYFLSTARRQEQPAIMFIGGNTEVARFYGLQTLRQLLDPVQNTVAVADIADRPSLTRRGAPIGIQWFGEQDELFNRMASLKLNFAWIQGSFLNEKFWFRWREPLSAEEMARIERWVEQANQHFIVPYIAIAPRGPDGSAPMIYSSNANIDLVVAKMASLYDLGVRNFGLSFDDLVNFEQDILYGEDVEFFNHDIGAAHVYLTEQIYNRLTVQHSDIQLTVVPMAYDALSRRGGTDEAYLALWAQLPPEIGMYSVVEETEGASAAIEFTNRPHMVWDNFWSSFYQRTTAPETVIPLVRPTEFDENLITGYSFAPLIPILEDEYLITWRTAADYAWAPERYDANVSFQLAAEQHLNHAVQGGGERVVNPLAIFPDSGTYAPPFTVTLNIAQQIAPVEEGTVGDPAVREVRYTIDGSLPTIDSPPYTSPLALHNGDRVRVRARLFEDMVAIGGLSTAFFQVSPEGALLPIVDLEPDPDESMGGVSLILRLAFLIILGSILILMGILGSIYWRDRSDNQRA